MRVVHLIDPGSPGGGACALAEIAALQRHARTARHDVVLLGPRRHDELAFRCGIIPIARVAIPSQLPPVARKRVRQVLQSIDRFDDRIEAIVAWTPRSAWLAANAAPHVPLLMRFSIGPIGRFDSAVLHWSLTGGRVPILAATESTAELWKRRGFNAADVSVIDPAVDSSVLGSTPRNIVRRQWKDEFGVDDGTFIIGLLGEPVSWPDLRMAVEIVGRVALAGRKVRLAMHHASARRLEAMTLLKRINMLELALDVDELAEPWRVMNGLDTALVLGVDFRAIGNAIRTAPQIRRSGSTEPSTQSAPRRPHPSVSPALWACAAGVPVIAHDLPSMRGIIEDGITGMLVNEHDMNGTSSCIARLYDDPSLRSRISTAATERAGETFSPAHLVDRIEQACEDAVNQHALHLSG